jgi:hypothetical protein
MKLHRLPALALASWYLLMPMFDPHNGKVVSLPLYEWTQEGIFENEKDCTAAKLRLVEDYEKNHAPRIVLNLIATKTMCVLSDDPRLEGKTPYSLAPVTPVR